MEANPGERAPSQTGWPLTRARRQSAWGWYLLVAVLLSVRVPSLVQPAGADQGLYAYVGMRILAGEMPYRDAWDQKPPAVHGIYALMYGAWPHDSVVAAADLMAAAAVAWMLVPLGRALTGGAIAGRTAAVLFLFLGDPTLGRLAGVRVRSQCETFIALAVTGALLLAVTWRRVGREPHETRIVSAARQSPLAALMTPFVIGLLLGIAAILKYNAIVYTPVALAALVAAAGGVRAGARACVAAAAGLMVPVLATIVVFAVGGALRDLYDATITYNLLYSGETYSGPLSYVGYLLTFPIAQARVDAIWTLGGLGCLVLLGHAARQGLAWRRALPVLWVAAACLSIAINGSRGLPQYFVQAVPALALSAGVAAAILWPAPLVALRWRSLARLAGVLVLATAVWRVTDLDKIPRNAAHDLAFMTGRITRDEHLARYGGRAEDKYSALGVAQLAAYLRPRTTPAQTIFIFGFSPGAYVKADRVSASRFFWSRPILFEFNAHMPGYGASGVLDELAVRSPAFVVLQIHDWAPAPNDSATYFLQHPLLGEWLRAHYRRVSDFQHDDYAVWQRRPI